MRSAWQEMRRKEIARCQEQIGVTTKLKIPASTAAVQWAERIMRGKIDRSGLLNRPIGASRLSQFRR
jgi:hypothetical protein